MTDVEIAVKKSENALAAKLLAEIYEAKANGRSDTDILDAVISNLKSKSE